MNINIIFYLKMNDNTYISRINELKRYFIFQIVLFGIILVFNFTLLFKIIWLYNLLYYLYLGLSSFTIIYITISIIQIVFLKLKKFDKVIIVNRFKKISVFMCATNIITGCSLTFALMVNSLETVDFCRECPFNLPYSYMHHLYDKYMNNNLNEKKLKDQCSNRRCLYNNIIQDNLYQYEYICNYNPSKEFEKIRLNINSNDTINQIECLVVDKNNINKYIFETNEIYKYLEICDNFNEFYICQRINTPKSYKIKEDFKCPEKNYLNYLIFFCTLNVLLNFILNFLTWRAVYLIYKIIIKLLSRNNNRTGTNSLNSTQNTSKIQKEDKEESFKEEHIETIIVCTKDNKSSNNIEQVINNNLTLSDNNINNIKINLQINNENNYNLKNKELNNEEIHSVKIINVNKNINISKEEEQSSENQNEINIVNNYKESSSERNFVNNN